MQIDDDREQHGPGGSRSEYVRRLRRVGTGRFVCDQRELGGELWMVSREGQSGWRVVAHHGSAAEAVTLTAAELRPWLSERARALEHRAAAQTQQTEP